MDNQQENKSENTNIDWDGKSNFTLLRNRSQTTLTRFCPFIGPLPTPCSCWHWWWKYFTMLSWKVCIYRWHFQSCQRSLWTTPKSRDQLQFCKIVQPLEFSSLYLVCNRSVISNLINFCRCARKKKPSTSRKLAEILIFFGLTWFTSLLDGKHSIYIREVSS